MARVNYDDYLKKINSNKIQPGIDGGEVNPTINPLPQSATTPRINSAYDYQKYMASQGQNVDLTPNKNIGSQPDNLQSYLEEYDKREGIDNPITPTTKPTTPEPNNPTTPTANNSIDTKTMWDKQRMQLAQSAVNQKAELDAINQKANSYVNAYMKALGLSGTSAGASQIAENSLNLANAYSQVNANEQQALNDARDTNGAMLIQAYQQALENGESSSKLDSIVDSYDDDAVSPGVKEYLKNITPSTNTWEGEKETMLQDISTQLEEKDSELSAVQKAKVESLVKDLQNAKTKEEYKDIYNEYKDAIQDVTKTAVENATVTNDYKGEYQYTPSENNKNLGGDYISNASAREKDFGDYNGTGEKGDTQSIWVNMLIDLANKGEIPNYSIVDMNVGAGSSATYVFKDGNWYKKNVSTSKKANASNSVTSIKNEIKKLTGKDFSAEIDEYIRNNK